MSRKSRNHGRIKSVKRGHWRFIDDHDGMVYDSSQAIIDHNGRITIKENFDPIHYSEMEIKYPIDQPIPWARPEAPNNFNTQPTLGTVNAVQYVPATFNDNFTPRSGYITATELSNYPDTHTYPYTGTNARYANYIAPPTFSVTSIGTVLPLNTGVTYPTLGNVPDIGQSDIELPEVSS